MCLLSCSGVGVLSPISASGSCEYITSAEHVEVFVTISHKYRGDLEITLISPSGVESILAYPHLEGSKTTPRAENYVEWRFTTLRNWGEPQSSIGGVWKLRVADASLGMQGTLVRWRLVMYGRCSGTGSSCIVSKISPGCGFLRVTGDAELRGLYSFQGEKYGKPYYENEDDATINRIAWSADGQGWYFSKFNTTFSATIPEGAGLFSSSMAQYPQDIHTPTCFALGFRKLCWQLSCPTFCTRMHLVNTGQNVYTAAGSYDLQLGDTSAAPLLISNRPYYHSSAAGLFLFYHSAALGWVLHSSLATTTIADLHGYVTDEADFPNEISAHWVMNTVGSFVTDTSISVACNHSANSSWYSSTSSSTPPATTPAPTSPPTSVPTTSRSPTPLFTQPLSSQPSMAPTRIPTLRPSKAPTRTPTSTGGAGDFSGQAVPADLMEEVAPEASSQTSGAVYAAAGAGAALVVRDMCYENSC